VDPHGLELDPERKRRWESLLAQLVRVRAAYAREMGGRSGLAFAAMHGFLSMLLSLARLKGASVSGALSFQHANEKNSPTGRLTLTMWGSKEPW
jgi:hypothetical protein